eukprot:GHVR01004853.1.p1 GENE.GHVR01004853.1~~GHVR01004853.1.p1  ORF type:complete len:217 (+),score=109.53 GHVR01004853.1:728-1378(+)
MHTTTWRDNKILKERLNKYKRRMDKDDITIKYNDFLMVDAHKINIYNNNDINNIDTHTHTHTHDDTQNDNIVEEGMSLLKPYKKHAQSHTHSPDEGQKGVSVMIHPESLSFFCSVGSTQTQEIRMKNTGSCVLYYEWINVQQEELFHLEDEKEDPPPPLLHSPFTCSKLSGHLLPGQSSTLCVSFLSKMVGVYTKALEFTSAPVVENTHTHTHTHT